MFWISNSNLTLTYTIDIYSHACHACCQLEACLPFRWPRPRLTPSHPGLEGIEELSLSLPCLPVKPQADLMAAVGSWLTAGRLPCEEGRGPGCEWREESPRSVTVQTRRETRSKSSLCVLHVCLLFVCGQSCCSPSALCQTDGVHMWTLRMNMRGLQVCRNCTQVSCSQVCVCLKPRSYFITNAFFFNVMPLKWDWSCPLITSLIKAFAIKAKTEQSLLYRRNLHKYQLSLGTFFEQLVFCLACAQWAPYRRRWWCVSPKMLEPDPRHSLYVYVAHTAVISWLSVVSVPQHLLQCMCGNNMSVPLLSQAVTVSGSEKETAAVSQNILLQ